MAGFIKGTTINLATTVTSQTLHSLIENARLTGIEGSDFSSGLFFISSTTATPNPSLAPFWYADDPEDPIFRVFATPWNIWLAVGPHRFEMPFRNSSGTDCLRGVQVIPSGASEFSLGSNPSINMLGFLQERTAAGSYGPVATLGICWVHNGTSASISGGGPGVAREAIMNRGCLPGRCASYPINATTTCSGPIFGIWLEGANRSGQSGPNVAKRALVWGPKHNVGFTA